MNLYATCFSAFLFHNSPLKKELYKEKVMHTSHHAIFLTGTLLQAGKVEIGRDMENAGPVKWMYLDNRTFLNKVFFRTFCVFFR